MATVTEQRAMGLGEWQALVRSLPALEAQQSLRLAQVALVPHISKESRRSIFNRWEDAVRQWSLGDALHGAAVTMQGLKGWMQRLFGSGVQG